MSFVCHSYVLVCHSYATRMYRMSLVCHTYVIRIYPYVIRMSLVSTCMSSVCNWYVFVCHPYVTLMYSYVTRMSLVCTRMSSVCHSSVVLPWTVVIRCFHSVVTKMFIKYSLYQFCIDLETDRSIFKQILPSVKCTLYVQCLQKNAFQNIVKPFENKTCRSLFSFLSGVWLLFCNFHLNPIFSMNYSFFILNSQKFFKATGCSRSINYLCSYVLIWADQEVTFTGIGN